MINKRERNLLIVVLAIVGCYGLFLLVRGAFLGPLELQATQIRKLDQDIAAKRKLMDEAVKAGNELAEWERISLPGDEETAKALYHDFLLKLIHESKFEELQSFSVDKIQKRPNFYTSVPFTIRGKITLENLTNFLYRFYQPNLLHQVRSLTISRTPESGGKLLTVTINVAGLAIDKVPYRDRLILEGEESVAPRLLGMPRDQFQLISKKNIFEPFREPSKEPEKVEPDIDKARHVFLTGCPQSSDRREAWLYDRLNNERKVLFAGDQLEMAGISAKVVDIAASGIVIAMDDKEWSLKLGKNLRDLKEIGAKPDTGGQTEQTSAEKPVAEPTSDGAKPAEQAADGEKPAADAGKPAAEPDPEKPAAEPRSDPEKPAAAPPASAVKAENLSGEFQADEPATDSIEP